MARRNALVLAIAGGLGLSSAAPALEQLGCRVEISDGKFEIRDYPPTVVAEVVRDGDRNASVSAAFRTLADFIFAKDRAGPKIAMTAPVTQTPEEPEETPASPLVASSGEWTVRFIMPDGSTLASLPKPSGDVRLAEVPAAHVAAVRFSGRWTDSNFAAAQAELQAWIAARRLCATGPATYAYYDPPFKPWFMRRNEVMIPVAPASRSAEGCMASS